MSFLPKNPFNKKSQTPQTQPSAQPSLASEIVSSPTPEPASQPAPETPTAIKEPSMPARDGNGKFISKKKLQEAQTAPETPREEKAEVKTEKEDVTQQAQEDNSPQAPTNPSVVKTPTSTAESQEPLVLTFYGFQVRKFYYGQWYFSLLDILALARVIQAPAYLQKLKDSPRTASIAKNNIRTFKYKTSDETTDEVEAVSYAGFMELFPFMRSDQTQFPGPFPEWLQNMSQTPLE